MPHYSGRGTTEGWSEAEIDRVYHRIPKDDAWKACTLARQIEDGERLWLHCNGCQRNAYLDARSFAEMHGIDPATPLLRIARRVRCTNCKSRKVSVSGEPYRGRGGTAPSAP